MWVRYSCTKNLVVGACEPNALSSDHKKSYLYNLEGLSSRIFVSTLQFFLLRFHGYLFAYQVYDWIFFLFLISVNDAGFHFLHL